MCGWSKDLHQFLTLPVVQFVQTRGLWPRVNFPSLACKTVRPCAQQRNCLSCYVHQNDTFAAESRNKKPGRKKGPENVCSATAASECCRYELPLPAAKYNMWPNRGRKWERGAITARGKELGRNPGVTFLSQPSWNKGSGSQPSRSFPLLRWRSVYYTCRIVSRISLLTLLWQMCSEKGNRADIEHLFRQIKPLCPLGAL